MRIQLGDTVVFLDDPRLVGVVERRAGDMLTVRLPEHENRREQVQRSTVRPLAEAMYEAREKGTRFRNSLSLTGASTLAELVAVFGYATRQLRQETLYKVWRQLQRAGLEVQPETDRWARDDKFKLTLSEQPPSEPPERVSYVAAWRAASALSEQPPSEPPGRGVPPPPLVAVTLPDPFWPTALGLDANREVAFLRALTAPEPILCLLHVPDNAGMQDWLQPTWEGIVGWAFRAAQPFRNLASTEYVSPDVLVGPAALLHTYLRASALDEYAPRLRDARHSLNLISLAKDSEYPVDFNRLRGVWPGPVFEFNPQPSAAPADVKGRTSADVRALLACLLLAAGCPPEHKEGVCPLKTLLWCREASVQILARASVHWGGVLASGALRKFKGSNESGTALALKAHLACWIRRAYPEAVLQFENHHVEQVEALDEGNAVTRKVSRTDLLVEGLGRFEVETLVGSGPIEAFYHQKVFARVKGKDSPLWLVVPNEAILWAGPYLADLAHHLGSRGHVLIPGAEEDLFLELQGRELAGQEIDIAIPWEDLRFAPGKGGRGKGEKPADIRLRLSDVAGYQDIRERVHELIIWPEQHRRVLRGFSRSSGILFFGPPGCGKSRLAQAIAGELEQEVRLLSPSDLRGAYVGWGQILIREQFDWVAQNERRMLVIDELDAVARSRREPGNMHSDEKANVNELLVQLDRVSRLGRIVVGTTNYVNSLDDAVVRSGRFGRFVPVPPPDIDEAIAILDYYLKPMTLVNAGDNQPRVVVPETAELRSILALLFADNARESRFFCGADLEEAVNRTYLRCLRQAMTGVTWTEDYSRVTVNLTKEELAHSLRDVPKSVHSKAIKQFIEDADRYCGSQVAQQFSKRLQIG